MLRSAVLHFYDTLSLRAPSLCTAVALTWIRALWGVEIKREPCLGAAKSHQKGSQNLTFKYCCLHVRLCMKSRRWHLCVHEWKSMRIHARKKCTWVCTPLHVKCVCQGGRASRPLIIHQQRPYMSLPEPLSLRNLIHYWEDDPEENRS